MACAEKLTRSRKEKKCTLHILLYKNQNKKQTVYSEEEFLSSHFSCRLYRGAITMKCPIQSVCLLF